MANSGPRKSPYLDKNSVVGLGSGLDFAAALAVANTVGDPSSQPSLAPLASYVARVSPADVAGQ